MNVGKIIQNSLREAKLSQFEVAEKIGISASSFSVMIRRESVSTDLVYKISTIIGKNLFAELGHEWIKENAVPETITMDQLRELVEAKCESLKDLIGKIKVTNIATKEDYGKQDNSE